ncbi:sulfonate transport system substrate-binding protein [Rhodococcus sp. 27YEA15]|uniref:ABC transporter substrate-binding protein n=1 Tax=Rhodococcus sp. 27YEA15 TaxID=3156259 RepID=UPI003C7D31C4
MKKSRFVIALAAIATIAAGTVGCSTNSDDDNGSVQFRSAFLPTANYLTTVRTTGILEDELGKVGATVKHIGPLDPMDAYNTVTSGNADASSTGTGYFVNLAANQGDWVAFALEKYSGNSQGIVAAPGSGINSLADLYGKKVGIDSPGATGDYLVHQAFKTAGLDISKVELVSLAQSDFAAAFTSGRIDALASFDQNFANAIATPGSKVLVTGDQIGSYNWSIHIASRDFAEKHPEELAAVYRGLVRESERAQADPSVITDAYREFGAGEDIVKVVAGFSTPQILPLDAAAVTDLNALASQYVDFGFIDKAPDMGNYVVDLAK